MPTALTAASYKHDLAALTNMREIYQVLHIRSYISTDKSDACSVANTQVVSTHKQQFSEYDSPTSINTNKS